MEHDAVRALSRGLDVLDALETCDGLPLRELHRLTDLPKPTLLRLLATLEQRGYVTQRLADRHWRRTVRGRSGAADGRERLLDHSAAVLRHLCRDVAWPSDVGVYRDGAMEIIETTRALTPLAIAPVPVGLRVSLLGSGLGRAWLAHCEDSERLRAVAQARQATDRNTARFGDRRQQSLEAVLERTRRKGYGCRAPAGVTTSAGQGDIGIAVPILSAGQLLGCINIVWRSSAMSEASFARRHLSRLQQAAQAIGTRISEGRPPLGAPA
ncbi:helix-turn-helix domain-containing protein [Bradyrhizobium sp. U87765 SZCCT0131]|uniref:helix-turn-helix domain-containing protein n=1 Tax=unclassified Bradyrhizobium TaxID=2631580 RepID=UPI001BAE151B|nr:MULTISPECIES: helix-turn-helix domain-containing protein [unclassified Bradyrhizobium]MBR1221081.1 helix-turn-helix domain-containing protein [Bradyrhizobium sp. U87765 SZCCT0131]MBR1260099.1 helix-turn-helix domain-containing protein [Bradyrhizobium sp. U87765 SZCCT0134]MBR1307652.1 helix-turn-helix domain-containing protein [Bradyrhizobium sp. U87765 SZCCT0110]MBR1321606.1 helix-turn-helix domain-containing protein [Bradyrhizobium sp. U87765 SZCCT0109]MBR1349919.1 helix-turn-helix domain-